ncbi:MAG TPA: hypothetical protein EYQ11_02270 [Candidatus Poseidoniales archaeon]|jgi:hypothetical protein|nr:hypothetical protein [Candidatus Poseidoniales archaeon]HIL68140.1 hypothetical protein [Candidatus Poseidoniales archaeon]
MTGIRNMPKFYGFGTCAECGIACTSGNFLNHESRRYCTACWVEKNNPEHPDLKEIREKVVSAVEEWKCTKWTREQGPLPLGPMPVKK